MNILVTGGCGFIGSHIVDALIAQNHSVIVVDSLVTGSLEFLNPNAQFVKQDIRDAELDGIFSKYKPEAVFHMAAQIDVQTSVNDPLLDASVNVLGLLNVLQCAVKHGVKRIIFPSSAAIYGAPQYTPVDEAHPAAPESPYGVAKLSSEYYLRAYQGLCGLEYVILRYANVYGPRQGDVGEGGVVAIFKKRLLNGKPCMIFGDGTATRDFVHVYDVAAANVLALTCAPGQTLNVGTGVQTSVAQLYDCMARAARSAAPAQYMPPRKGDILHSYFDVTHAREVMGFAATIGIEQGIAQFFDGVNDVQ